MFMQVRATGGRRLCVKLHLGNQNTKFSTSNPNKNPNKPSSARLLWPISFVHWAFPVLQSYLSQILSGAPLVTKIPPTPHTHLDISEANFSLFSRSSDNELTTAPVPKATSFRKGILFGAFLKFTSSILCCRKDSGQMHWVPCVHVTLETPPPNTTCSLSH